MDASSPAPRNHQWRRGMGSGRHTGQQINQSEVVIPSEMERLQNGTQLMGTPGKCSCSGHHSRLLSETPGSSEAHPVDRIFLPPIPTYHHAEMSRFWRGGWMLEDTTVQLLLLPSFLPFLLSLVFLSFPPSLIVPTLLPSHSGMFPHTDNHTTSGAQP